MSDTKTAGWIAALERARAELERGLSADEHWRGLREGGAQSGRPDRAHGHERALADNPVYRCWEQLNGAIEALRRTAQAGPNAPRRRVSLREEQIRSDAALPDSEAQSAAPDPPSTSEPAGRGTPPVAPAGSAPPEPEEATVSFVIREPVRPAPAAGQGGEASGPKRPAPGTAPEPELDPGAEAEVTIVPVGVPQRR